MSKFGRRQRTPPEGFDYIEPVLTALENELREKVNEPHEGLRKNESQWPIHQINWQKSRYVYDMYYTYNRISKEVYDYCINNKIVDGALIAKWKKPGYERLCSTYVINPRNYKFGTVSICRVPKQSLAPGTEIQDPTTGCLGCASGSNHNIFGNKYGQYLAAIQIAREERAAARAALRNSDVNDSDRHNKRARSAVDGSPDSENEDDELPVTEADGSSRRNTQSLWSDLNEQSDVLTEEMVGSFTGDAKREAMSAASRSALGKRKDIL